MDEEKENKLPPKKARLSLSLKKLAPLSARFVEPTSAGDLDAGKIYIQDVRWSFVLIFWSWTEV